MSYLIFPSYFVQPFMSALVAGRLALLWAPPEGVCHTHGLDMGGLPLVTLGYSLLLGLTFPSVSTASLRSNTGLPSLFALDESDLAPPPLPPPLSPLCLFFSLCSCLFRSATCFVSPLSSLTSSLVGGSTEKPASLNVCLRILFCSSKSAGGAPVALH